MKINPSIAKTILLYEADQEASGNIDPKWQKYIETFSQICEGTSKTHIAFLGTTLLAKSVDISCDAFSVKAGDDSPGAYSARSLAHGVLVPLAPKLDINLGVTGREPLNNQPYFRIKRVSRDIPVRGSAQKAIDFLMELLNIINEFEERSQARIALRAFIHVRRKYSPNYASLGEDIKVLSTHEISEAINSFVEENSEGGKRAQAIVAGLLDLFSGSDRVLSGRINDPDWHLPGDVGIKNRENSNLWEKVFEVRDKVVSDEDAYLFIQKSIENDIKEVAVVCVHSAQNEFNTEETRIWAKERGVSITFFFGWFDFISQIVFWAEKPQIEALKEAHKLIYDRLIGIEASEEAVSTWTNILRTNPI